MSERLHPVAQLPELQVQTVSNRIVAIVSFGPRGFTTDGFKPGEYFQVTIDPKKVSPSGEYIRFGTYPADEIVGWQRCEAITICEVLGEWPHEEETCPALSFGSASGVTMLAPLQEVVK